MQKCTLDCFRRRYGENGFHHACAETSYGDAIVFTVMPWVTTWSYAPARLRGALTLPSITSMRVSYTRICRTSTHLRVGKHVLEVVIRQESHSSLYGIA